MTLDEAREVLRTFTFAFDEGNKENVVRLLDVTPATSPVYFNVLVSLLYPGADPGLLTDRELEAIGVYVGQWSEEEALDLIAKAYLEEARDVE